MIRIQLTAVLLSSLFLLPYCKKGNTREADYQELVLARAKKYFDSMYKRQDAPGQPTSLSAFYRTEKNPVWTAATVQSTGHGEVVIVPVAYEKNFPVRSSFNLHQVYSINDISSLLIYTEPGRKFKVEWVVAFPDSLYTKRGSGQFSGIVQVSDWERNDIETYRYNSDGSIEALIKRNEATALQESNVTNASAGPITVCHYIEGYNTSADGGTYYWSELIGCDTYFVPVNDFPTPKMPKPQYGTVGGGGGGKPVSPAIIFRVPAPDYVINNTSEYNKCFTNKPGTEYKYQVSLCVMQPKPGTREPWIVGSTGGTSATGNPVFVGHTYLILTQTTPTKTVVRNIGFYPATGVTPMSPVAKGQFNNDEQRKYDIALNITMNNSQFFNLLNYIAQGDIKSWQYDLNYFNCTSFALNALAAAGITVPRTSGSWVGGSGNNPGDLGEDIRGMQLQPNMTRSTTFGTHPNQGTCN